MANTISNNRTSNIINSQVPFFVRNDHQKFVKFLEAYYRYLEQNDKVINRIKNIQRYYDIDLTEDVFAEKMYKTFLKYIPQSSNVDKKLLLKNVKDFYRSKGTEKSVRFLMNIIFNEFPNDIYYPKEDILRASDGKWYIKKTIRIKDVFINSIANSEFSGVHAFVGTKIKGNTSNTLALVEEVDRFYENNVLIDELILSNIDGNFEGSESIFATFDQNGKENYISANVFGGQLTDAKIISPGTLYTAGTQIPLENEGDGSGGVVTITKVTSGSIKDAFVIYGGSGYQKDGQVEVTALDLTGTGATAKVLDVDVSGNIHPNSYNIIYSPISLIIDEVIGYAANTSNLTMFTGSSKANTSNLTMYTGSGATVTTVNLSAWTANSNVAIAQYDRINVNNTTVMVTFVYPSSNIITVTPGLDGNLIANTIVVDRAIRTVNLSKWTANSNVTINLYDNLNVNTYIVKVTSITPSSNIITIDPGLPGNIVGNTVIVTNIYQNLNYSNVNTTIQNATSYWAYSNTGPIDTIVVLTSGLGYSIKPEIKAISNTQLLSLGILGRFSIINGGVGYEANDVIYFDNPYGCFGTGAIANVYSVNATGAITDVRWKNYPGEYPGGSGYTADNIPIANIISQNVDAFGANVIVTGLLGTGANIVAGSSIIGSIEEVVITSRGANYSTPPTLNLTSLGDGTGVVTISTLPGVITYPGRYLNDDGHISSYNFLQDRDYYQSFSYVIRSSQSVEKYRQAIMDLVHPIGMKMFGEYDFLDENLEYYNIIQANDSSNNSYIAYSATYAKSMNTITIFYPSHGKTVTSNTYLEFDRSNVENALYYIWFANTNYFRVNSHSLNVTINSSNTFGNVDVFQITSINT